MTEKISVRIGTSEKGGTFWTEGEALAAVLRDTADMDVTVLDAVQASIENGRRLDARLIEFGFMASNWIGRAKNADPPFDEPVEVRNVAPANTGAMFFIAKRGSALETMRDLIGKKVAIGPEGSGMVQHIHTIFRALDIPFESISPVYLSFEEGGSALEVGEVDAQWQCPYPNEVMRDISERMDVKVLNHAKGDLAKIFDAVDFYRPSKMRAGFFRGLDRDTDQLAVVNIIAAHERTDEEAVRRVVSTILANFDRLAEANPLYQGLAGLFEPLRTEGPSALEFGGVPLHPGALIAYREAGYLD